MAADREKVDLVLMETEEKMDKAVSYLRSELSQIRAGRANPRVLDKVLVDYYGQMQPINQMSNVAVQDGKCLVISPWDKSMLKAMEKAISASNLGINPINDGNVIRLVFPDLTEERRKELIKQTKVMSEDSKVAVRNCRRDALDSFKKMKNAKEITDDEFAEFSAEIEKMTTAAIDTVTKVNAEKEKDLMTV
ncbi:MAG: ribosome recycling factor [Christensenellaceae bacterium]